MIRCDMSEWRGRVDVAEGDLALRWHQVVRPFDAAAGLAVGILGLASDEGVRRNQGRTGASEGPSALRRQLANLPASPALSLVDAGTVLVEDRDLEGAQAEYASLVERLLDGDILPIGLGGGHEIAYGTFLGLSRHLAGRGAIPRIGIVSLDTHFDLRASDAPTSGTSFRQIAALCDARGWPFRYTVLGVSAFSNTEALFRTAAQLGVRWRLDEAMGPADLPEIEALVSGALADVDALYLTICLDVLPAADAPGVSAPSARGVPLDIVERVVDAACASGKLRAADVAELNPALDEDSRTARVAARIVGRIASFAGRPGTGGAGTGPAPLPDAARRAR